MTLNRGKGGRGSKVCRLLMQGCISAFLLVLSIASAYAQEVCTYSIYISFPKGNTLSGVCVTRMEQNGDGALSIVNEFGIKAFDALYTADKDKLKLQNVIKMLDKWYMRRVIAKDMALILNPHKKIPKSRTVSRPEDGSILLTNKRFKITYQLQPIDHVTE
ncbi:MAG: hypothetical protein Q4D56_08985 [Bacteroides sp.]|nr:hypothetical protein [Bacteroides sp.]